jgi:hypothetical protein
MILPSGTVTAPTAADSEAFSYNRLGNRLTATRGGTSIGASGKHHELLRVLSSDAGLPATGKLSHAEQPAEGDSCR